MITAQDLYDRRDERGGITGSELHDLFYTLTDDPSPLGFWGIDPTMLSNEATELRTRYAAHKAAAGVGGEYLLDMAAFCESFVR